MPPGPSGKAWSAVSSVPGLTGALVTLSAYPGRYQSCPGRRRGGAGRGGAIGAAANHSEPLAPLPVPVQFPPPPPSPARPPSHLRRPPPSPAPTRPLPPRRHAGPRRGGPQRTPRCRRPRSARDASPAETRAPGRPPPAARRLLRPRDKAGRPVLREPRHAVLFSVPPGRSKGLTLCVARWQVSGEQAPDGSGGGRAATACRKAAQAVRPLPASGDACHGACAVLTVTRPGVHVCLSGIAQSSTLVHVLSGGHPEELQACPTLARGSGGKHMETSGPALLSQFIGAASAYLVLQNPCRPLSYHLVFGGKRYCRWRRSAQHCLHRLRKSPLLELRGLAGSTNLKFSSCSHP